MNSDKLTIVGELKNWRRHVCSPDGTCVFWGNIYGDIRHRFPDGDWIHTAKVARVEGDLVFTTSGSVYRLVGKAAGPDVNLWSDET